MSGNGNGKPLGGGRGTLMEMIKKKQAERERQAQLESDAASAAAAPQGISRGRAELFAKIRQKAAEKEQPGTGSSGESSGDSSVPVVGGGRANLLKKLLEQKERAAAQAQSQKEQTAPPPAAPKPTPLLESDPQTSTGSGSGLHEQVEKLSIEDSRTTSDSAEPVIRRGESGQKVTLTTNYINIYFKPGFGIFQYVVKFNPNIESIQIRRQMLRQHIDYIGQIRNFDGVLYVPQKLRSDNITLDCKHPADESLVTMQLLFKKEVPPTEHSAFFNNLLRRVMAALQLVPIGRQNFCPKTGEQLPQHRLELWPGYITSISDVEGGLKLCIDATHRAIRTETVRDILNKIGQNCRGNFQEAAIAELVGTSVLTLYNNRVYRIDDIAFNESPQTTFEKNGKKISLVEYYKEHWNIVIRDHKQPLLIHNAVKRQTNGEKIETMSYLIPELCNAAGLTDAIRKDFKIMKDIAQVTQVSPDNRRNTIRKFIKEVNSNTAASQILSGWGITLDDDIMSFPGRKVDDEDIFFGDQVVCKGSIKANWSNDAVRNPVLQTPNLNSWAILFIEQNKQTANDFIKMLQKVTGAMRIRVAPPKICVLQNDRADTIVNQLRRVISEDLELVTVILPTNRTDRYNAVKKICCAEIPVASQVIIQKTIARADKLKSVTEKIALQINCKLGGTLWSLKIPLKKTMIVGVDVYHSPAGQKRTSVVGFVASTDANFTKWYSKACFQNPHQEMIDVLKACLINAVKAFKQANGNYPEKVLMYRDGVGDGQLETVNKFEVPQLLATFCSIEANYKPELAVIIVQKRINTRLMLTKGNGLMNPLPGTIADMEVTRRNYYDFYLVPQTANRGTVSPTHYIVLHDNSGLSPDKVQRLSFKMCHMYYNWSGTIKVPAPCQYAHKIAYLVGQNVQMEPHDSLSNRLYYL